MVKAPVDEEKHPNPPYLVHFPPFRVCIVLLITKYRRVGAREEYRLFFGWARVAIFY